MNLYAKTIKQSFIMSNARKSIKVIVNGKDFKKRNSEFIHNGNALLRKPSFVDKQAVKERFSLLDDERFFSINKIDPRLDE